MRAHIWNLLRGRLSLVLKCGSVFLLFLVSVLIVACGANNSVQAPGTPVVTVTINLNQVFSSPTPKLADYSCGAWATESNPVYSPGNNVQVYAKFVHNIGGNPVGMNGANARATVFWPNGGTQIINATTTSDGLAIFPVPLQASALGHIVIVTVDFTSADGQHVCNVPPNAAAFFTAVVVSPTPSPSATPAGTPGVTPTGVPTCTPTLPPFPRRTPTPTPPIPLPTPPGC
ncbi:MAG TPA: hypothetical protein VFV38_38220 [Ktedonobacteraceae bacterium]|nr:hypothetical protein [Ktedonobacteraceae bacterium]